MRKWQIQISLRRTNTQFDTKVKSREAISAAAFIVCIYSRPQKSWNGLMSQIAMSEPLLAQAAMLILSSAPNPALPSPLSSWRKCRSIGSKSAQYAAGQAIQQSAEIKRTQFPRQVLAAFITTVFC